MPDTMDNYLNYVENIGQSIGWQSDRVNYLKHVAHLLTSPPLKNYKIIIGVLLVPKIKNKK